MQTFNEYLADVRQAVKARKKDIVVKLPRATLSFSSECHFDKVRPGDDVMVHPGWIGKALFPVGGVPSWWVVAKFGESNRSVEEQNISVIGRDGLVVDARSLL